MKGKIDADTWNLDATTFSSNLCEGGRDKKRARFFYEKERVRMIEADGWSNNYNRAVSSSRRGCRGRD